MFTRRGARDAPRRLRRPRHVRARPRRHERGAHAPHGDDGRLDPGADRHPGAALGTRGNRELGPRARGDEAGPRPGGLEGHGHRGDHLRHALPRSHVPGRRLLPQREARHPGRARARRPEPVHRVPLRPLRRGRVDPRRRVQARPARRLGDPLDRARRLDARARRGGDLRRRRGCGAPRGDRRAGPRRPLGAPPRRRSLREGALDGRARLQVPPARPGRADRVRRGLPTHGGPEGLQARHLEDAGGGARPPSRRTGSRRRT